jgi:DNA invertase Pin-like site-specific DNA recombinase
MKFDTPNRCGHQVIFVWNLTRRVTSSLQDLSPSLPSGSQKAAVRREFDILAVWSSDRLGRSLQHLIEVLQTIRDTGCGLYIHTQALGTTTPSGRAMFQMLAVFGEFEREMIIARVNAGMAWAKKEGTKSGKAIGRPEVSAKLRNTAIEHLRRGVGILKTAKAVGLGTGTVQKIKREMTA